MISERPAAAKRSRNSTTFACLAFAVLVAGATIRGYYESDWNFDAVPYVAAAYSLSIEHAAEVHRRTFDDLRDAVPPRAFELLTSGSEYRKAIFASPVALHTQRRLYINKPAYVLLIAALRQIGINAARATRIISAGAFATLGLMVLFWLWSVRARPLLVLSAALFIGAPPFAEMASLSTPDMLAALPLIVAAWMVLVRGRYVSGILCASAAIFIRPDTSIAVLLLASWATFFAPAPRLRIRTLFVTCAAIAIGTFLLQKAIGATSLPSLLRHTFESRLYEPARMTESISMVGYLRALLRGLSGASLYHPSVLPLHLALSLITMGVLARSGTATRALWGWTALTWTYVPLHYFVLPDPSDRFFAPAYLLAGLGMISFATFASAHD